MAIVFREGHLLLSVRYMVIIFQSIKRLYLAQLAACTKVKESDSPSSLWSRCILMKQMQRGASSPRSGTTEESYGSPAAPGSGSFGDINAKHKHAAALSIKVCASRLNSRRPSAVLLCYYSAGSSLREASVLLCVELCADAASPNARTKNVRVSQGRKLHITVYRKLEKDVQYCTLGQAENSSKTESIHLLSILECFEQHSHKFKADVQTEKAFFP